ncbi:hypothetical protein GCM10009646_76810 [Streptomyces aureus]
MLLIRAGNWARLCPILADRGARFPGGLSQLGNGSWPRGVTVMVPLLVVLAINWSGCSWRWEVQGALCVVQGCQLGVDALLDLAPQPGERRYPVLESDELDA